MRVNEEHYQWPAPRTRANDVIYGLSSPQHQTQHLVNSEFASFAVSIAATRFGIYWERQSLQRKGPVSSETIVWAVSPDSVQPSKFGP